MPALSSNKSDSELSDLDSSASFNKLEDEIVVSGRNTMGAPKVPSLRPTSKGNADEVMEDAPEELAGLPCPERKRTSAFNDLSGSKLGSADTTTTEGSLNSPTLPTSPTGTTKVKPSLQRLGGLRIKGTLLGTWRDSRVPDDEKKHAVIGFIDVRDRLRTRIQPDTKHGESLAEYYPLPAGPTGCWVTFERVIFSDHLVGLDRSEVKEYTRLRSEAVPEETEDGRIAAENAAVREAIRRVKENPVLESSVQPPAIAYGVDIPGRPQALIRPNLGREQIDGGFAAINPSPPEIATEPAAIPTPQQSIGAGQTRCLVDPLPGTRPTCILIGHWKLSSEVDLEDRHAAYGVLDQNDVFRVQVVRRTRDGRFVGGNHSSGIGSLWIFYDDVELEPHLRALNRQEVVEYCRVRQNQLDHGETCTERIENETKAVYEAQIRTGRMPYKRRDIVTVPTFTASPKGNGDERLNGRHSYGGYDPRQSARTEPRFIPVSMSECERHPSRLESVKAMERTRALTRHEIGRRKATEGRADRHAMYREHVVVATTADNENSAAVAAMATSNISREHRHSTNSRTPFHASDDMQRLNKGRARQEMLPMKSNLGDVKMYDGEMYERKATGPFMGKLVSQGTIISIDGDDYVEYRVLTKPSFCWNPS